MADAKISDLSLTTAVSTDDIVIRRASANYRVPLSGVLALTANGIVAPTIDGSAVANGDITIQGTTDSTRTTSYVLLQPNGGNVGIGSTAPSAILHVDNPLGASSTTIGARENRILLTSAAGSAGSDTGSELVFGYKDLAAARFAAISATFQGVGTNQAIGNLVLSTKTALADTTLTPRVTIQYNGNVGIGTSVPVSRLEISGNQDHLSDTGAITISQGATPAKRLILGYQESGDFAYIASLHMLVGAKPLVLQPAAGNVGIGETAPTASLDLPASTTAQASLRLRHGVAPTTPNDGDIWTTTAGLFVRINGATVGPLS